MNFLPEMKNPHIMYNDDGSPQNYGLSSSIELFEEYCSRCGTIQPDCTDDLSSNLGNPCFVCRKCYLTGLISRLNRDIELISMCPYPKKICDARIKNLKSQINKHTEELNQL